MTQAVFLTIRMVEFGENTLKRRGIMQNEQILREKYQVFIALRNIGISP